MNNDVDAIAGSLAAQPVAQRQTRRWILPWGQSYSAEELHRDLLAAFTVAAISLPQAMAYALLAGVDPRYGLYSAIVVTAVASIFGSSSHLINGPTSAISLVVFAALAAFDPDQRVEAAEGMFLLGVMIGAIQIAIGAFRLGDLTRYISESVILGFMSAAAALLAIGQIGTALGLRERGTGGRAASVSSPMAHADPGRTGERAGLRHHRHDFGARLDGAISREPLPAAADGHAGCTRRHGLGRVGLRLDRPHLERQRRHRRRRHCSRSSPDLAHPGHQARMVQSICAGCPGHRVPRFARRFGDR